MCVAGIGYYVAYNNGIYNEREHIPGGKLADVVYFSSDIGMDQCALVHAYIAGEVHNISQLTSWDMFPLIIYTVVVGNIIAYTGYTHLLRKYPITLISLSGLLIPFFVHLYGAIQVDEKWDKQAG